MTQKMVKSEGSNGKEDRGMRSVMEERMVKFEGRHEKQHGEA
jgi:hypothetical protein